MLHGFLFSWERESVRMETEIISNEKKMSPTKRWKYSRRDCTKLCILDINFFYCWFWEPISWSFQILFGSFKCGASFPSIAFPHSHFSPRCGPHLPFPQNCLEQSLSCDLHCIFFIFYFFGRRSALHWSAQGRAFYFSLFFVLIEDRICYLDVEDRICYLGVDIHPRFKFWPTCTPTDNWTAPYLTRSTTDTDRGGFHFGQHT